MLKFIDEFHSHIENAEMYYVYHEIHRFIVSSLNLFIYLSIHLSIYLSIYRTSPSLIYCLRHYLTCLDFWFYR